MTTLRGHDAVVLAGTLLAEPGLAPPVTDGWLAIDAGRISAVGTGPPPPAATVHDHRDDVVLPGFVNTHAHLTGALVRGLGGDRSTRLGASGTRPTVAVRLAMGREEARAAARLALLEMLLSGVTTTIDSQPALRGRTGQADGTLTALRESGMRVVWFRSSIDRTGFFPAEAHDDLATASADLQRLDAEYASSRLDVGVEAMALHRVDDALLDGLIGLARSRSMPFGIHGPYDEVAARHSIDRFGRTVVAELAERGALDARLLLAHPVVVDQEDIEMLADAGAGVSVCAVDNMLIGTSAAPLRGLLAAGVRVGLGLDQPNDGHDMFQLMKATILQQRAQERSPDFGSPARMLELATAGGARALRLEGEVGGLTQGRAADLVALDGTHPALHPLATLESNLVYAAGPQVVRSVYLEGRRVVHEGRHADWDHGEIAAHAEEAFRRCRGTP